MQNAKPIDYIDGTSEAAADLLSRTLVASRKVGGYIKQANPGGLSAFLAHPEVAQTLRNTAIGGGIGGLGSLALGMGARKRRDPLASALSGAIAGAAIGGGGTLAYNALGPASGDGTQRTPAAERDVALLAPTTLAGHVQSTANHHSGALTGGLAGLGLAGGTRLIGGPADRLRALQAGAAATVAESDRFGLNTTNVANARRLAMNLTTARDQRNPISRYLLGSRAENKKINATIAAERAAMTTPGPTTIESLISHGYRSDAMKGGGKRTAGRLADRVLPGLAIGQLLSSLLTPK